MTPLPCQFGSNYKSLGAFSAAALVFMWFLPSTVKQPGWHGLTQPLPLVSCQGLHSPGSLSAGPSWLCCCLCQGEVAEICWPEWPLLPWHCCQHLKDWGGEGGLLSVKAPPSISSACSNPLETAAPWVKLGGDQGQALAEWLRGPERQRHTSSAFSSGHQGQGVSKIEPNYPTEL